MKLLADIYRSLKKVPVIGDILILFRSGYKNSWFYAQKLHKKDRRKAEQVVINLFGTHSEEMTYLNDLLNSDVFKNQYSYGHSGDFDVMMLYVLVRSKKPEVVVETGVASGRSSSVILKALEENNKGKLYSVDLPHFYDTKEPGYEPDGEGNDVLVGYVPKGNEPGWLVPQELRHRWELILGDSKAELPKLVNRLEKIDIFYHDSDHSYDYMKFEFNLVWPKVEAAGYFLSDDINWNRAWREFLSDKKFSYKDSYRNFGIIKVKK